MSKAKHTPGKWSASQGYDNMYNQAVMEISSEGTEQFVTLWSGQDYIDDTTKANARLIAEAPTMLGKLNKAKRIIRSLKLSMQAHPDNEPGSEFDDFTTSAQEMEDEIEALIKKIVG